MPPPFKGCPCLLDQGTSLQYCTEALRGDPAVVLASLATSGSAHELMHATPSLRADRNFMLRAVAIAGKALRSAAPELRADEGLVMAAVAESGEALAFAAPELQADARVALTAVAQTGLALRFASEALRADEGIVLAAVATSGGPALAYAAENPWRRPSASGGRGVSLVALVSHELQSWRAFNAFLLGLRTTPFAETEPLPGREAACERGGGAPPSATQLARLARLDPVTAAAHRMLIAGYLGVPTGRRLALLRAVHAWGLPEPHLATTAGSQRAANEEGQPG